MRESHILFNSWLLLPFLFICFFCSFYIYVAKRHRITIIIFSVCFCLRFFFFLVTFCLSHSLLVRLFIRYRILYTFYTHICAACEHLCYCLILFCVCESTTLIFFCNIKIYWRTLCLYLEFLIFRVCFLYVFTLLESGIKIENKKKGCLGFYYFISLKDYFWS